MLLTSVLEKLVISSTITNASEIVAPRRKLTGRNSIFFLLKFSNETSKKILSCVVLSSCNLINNETIDLK
jgi:hypothetical protein